MDLNIKNQINIADSLIILILALFTNIFSEFLSWLFIYKKKNYKNCKKQIDILNKKIEISKESTKNKLADKRAKQQEAELKVLNMEMMKVISKLII